MTKFCTNCGHANNQDNRNCIECGTALTPAAEKDEAIRQPVKLRTKMLAATVILFLAAAAGFYNWGTESASAETAVSKFHEAIAAEDAALLADYAILSDGTAITEQEAPGLIELFKGYTAEELELWTTVEKHGKKYNLFDAYKIVLNPQDAKFFFPYKGLQLTINGDLQDSQFTDGEYLFTGLVPGVHEAEFHYEGEFSDLIHPFKLNVPMSGKTAMPIETVLPISDTVFELGQFSNPEAIGARVVINDQEFPFNESGMTQPIGPMFLDGSITAQVKADFPWGTMVSEPVPVSESRQPVADIGLDLELKEALILQLVKFEEEVVKAHGLLDASVFTTIAQEPFLTYKREIEDMKRSDARFKGLLVEVNIDEHSIVVADDGVSAYAEAEVVTQSASFTAGDKKKLSDYYTDKRFWFIYDQAAGKWLVDRYDTRPWSADTLPTRTIPGSGTLYSLPEELPATEVDKIQPAADASETEEEQAPVIKAEEAEETESATESEVVAEPAAEAGQIPAEVEAFFQAYNDASVEAINSGDFSLVSGFITGNGPRRAEQAEFVDRLASLGVTEEHLGTTVEAIEQLDGGIWRVTTLERFIIHGTERTSEKEYRTVTDVRKENDGWLVHELISTTEL